MYWHELEYQVATSMVSYRSVFDDRLGSDSDTKEIEVVRSGSLLQVCVVSRTEFLTKERMNQLLDVMLNQLPNHIDSVIERINGLDHVNKIKRNVAELKTEG